MSVLSFITEKASAAIYNGPGFLGGLNAVSGVTGVTNADPRTVVIGVVQTVLSYMALLAVVMVIAAGIYLIVGMGSDDSREKAKKIILYTLIGLLIIFFAKVIVGLVTIIVVSKVR